MPTYREALSQLPQPYRAAAIANTKSEKLDLKFTEETHVLAWAFTWDGSREGRAFWEKVEAAAENGTPFPPLTPNMKRSPQPCSHCGGNGWEP